MLDSIRELLAMKKNVFVFVTFVVIILVVVMSFTKPEPIEHYNGVRSMAMNVVHQELARKKLPEMYETKAALEAAEKINAFIKNRMEVKDYTFVNVGWMRYQGSRFPVTIGYFGKIHNFIEEDQVRQVFLKGWSSDYSDAIKKRNDSMRITRSSSTQSQ